MMEPATERVHLPSGSDCDAGEHHLQLCVDCGLGAASNVFAAAECCPCAPCACCKED